MAPRTRRPSSSTRIGRPPKAIDPKLVEQLAAIHCTHAEIAAVCGCSTDTLVRRFADLIEKGKQEGKASLRRAQWKLAQAGNATMCIWLGKQLLGQHDRREFTGADGGAIAVRGFDVVFGDGSRVNTE